MPIIASDNLKTYFHKKTKGIPIKGIESVLALSEEGATVPFIARYRKEKTGNLDEVQIRDIVNGYENWQELVKRKEFILVEVAKQGNLTDILEKQIKETFEMAELEELYRPFKRKRKTKATLAREAGIEPLADWIWALGHGELEDSMSVEVKSKDFLNSKAGFAKYDEVLKGAHHIIVERLSNDADLRKLVRDEYQKNAKIICEKGPKFKEKSKFEMYAEFSDSIKNLMSEKASHRYLALRRGWQETELKVKMQADDEKLLLSFEGVALTKPDSQTASFLKFCAKAAMTVHVLPSIVSELHRVLKTSSDVHAINVFAQNVRKVLMASPFGAKVVLGIDPGIRTGCKVALVDDSGNFISHTVLYTNGDGAKETAKKLFSEVTKQIQIKAIAVGNGTAGRETEKFISDIFKEMKIEVPLVLVNESGASIYSASDIAREEFPELDLTIRGAISIARRLQDPLAELVKIDPKSIGVGQYQHDVSQTFLKKSLHEVVESCVNTVGVNLNTASSSLLQYVAGIGPAIAQSIVEYRKENGLFNERGDLLKVNKISDKVFEQSVGFLRLPKSKVPLDATGVHPEKYHAVQDMAKEAGLSVSKLMGQAKAVLDKEKWSHLLGQFTFEDIVKELDSPSRDPRDPFKVFKFREDIHEVKDLKEGMMCPGIVTNVTNFGAFVDVGVHQDGLVHISELSFEFIDDPKKVVSPGDQVQVKVLKVDTDKSQVSLSMLVGEKPKTPAVAKKSTVQSTRPSAKGGRGPGGSTNKRPGGGYKGKASNKRGARPKGKPNTRPDRPKRPSFGNNPFADLASQLKGSK